VIHMFNPDRERPVLLWLIPSARDRVPTLPEVPVLRRLGLETPQPKEGKMKKVWEWIKSHKLAVFTLGLAALAGIIYKFFCGGLAGKVSSWVANARDEAVGTGKIPTTAPTHKEAEKMKAEVSAAADTKREKIAKEVEAEKKASSILGRLKGGGK